MKNIYIGAIVVAAVLGASAFFGVSPFLKSVQYLVGSAVGTTFNTAKVAAINMTISSASATSSSLLNSDSSDRYITDSFAACNTVGTSKTAYTGAGLAALVFNMSTTSTNAPAVLSNTNYVASMTLATGTVVSMASSTVGDVGTSVRIWPAGSYLTIQPNATNTAACTVGVHYLGS